VIIGHSLGGKVALEWLRQLVADDRGLGLPKQVKFLARLRWLVLHGGVSR
jgi:esterase/lipase superfamily enzyme